MTAENVDNYICIKMNVTMVGHKLATLSIDNDSSVTYWTDGRKIYFRQREINGADIDSFEWFDGGWAKDDRRCYINGIRLQNAIPATFSVLNRAYAKDKSNVWTLGGQISDADSNSFEVCDSGTYYSSYSALPYGFAKDKNNVYYTEFSRKGTVVKKANPATFHSLDDGFFGFDDAGVFCKSGILPKADPLKWQKIQTSGLYSICENRIYYQNKLLKSADAETFEVITEIQSYNFAKDKNSGFSCEKVISFQELDAIIKDYKEQ